MSRSQDGLARLRRYAPPPRAVDFTLLAAVLTLVATGVASAFAGSPGDGWLFVVHGLAGTVLVGFLALKLWRVRGRVRRATHDPSVATSVALAALTLSALATGIAWVLGAPLSVPGPFPLLVVHAFLGLAVVVPFLLHLRARLRLPSGAEAGRPDRRRALGYAGVALAGGLAYRAQGTLVDLLDTPGARRRFTGSRERGSGAGNRFPVTAWVADDPDPIDPDEWALRVRGRVEEPLALDYGDLSPTTDERAILDCTSGWYSEHGWTGVRVGDLLDRAGVDDRAAWVQFRSVTGYRWSLPLSEARDALLAARVDGERLSHGHGFPLRLVAPGRRGFQWVKWVEAVRVTRRREAGEWVAIFASGIDE